MWGSLRLAPITHHISLTCAQTNAVPRSQPPAQLFAILGTRRLVNANTCLSQHIAYARVSTVSKWLTVSKWWTIPTLNRKELEMQRSELLWSLSGTHTLRLSCHCRVQQSFNPANVLISNFFTGQTDRLTDWQTDKTDCLTPLRMRARGNNGPTSSRDMTE